MKRAVLDAARATGGTELRLDLELDEPLAAPPEVFMLSGEEALPPLPWSVRGEDHQTLSCTYRVTGEESPGPYVVLVHGWDAAGNELADVAVAEVELDFAAPAVRSATVGPLLAAPGDVVRVNVTLNEPAAAPPELTARPGEGEGIGFDLVDAAGELLSFRHVVLAREGGAYRLVLSGVVDTAGNDAGALELDDAVVFDETGPQVLDYGQSEPAREGGDVFSGGDTLAVGFRPDEPLGREPAVRLGPLPLACGEPAEEDGRYACTLALAGTGLVGHYPVSLELVDRVGNGQVAEHGQAEVDALPPWFVSASFAPSPAPLGSTALLTITGAVLAVLGGAVVLRCRSGPRRTATRPRSSSCASQGPPTRSPGRWTTRWRRGTTTSCV